MLLTAVAMGVTGCGAAIEFGNLRFGLPSPPPAPDPGHRAPAERQTALDQLIERISSVSYVPSGEVVLRLSLTGGWELPERGDLHLSIEDDGRVVRVTDTSVFSSTRDYTSLRLSRDGVVRLLESVRPLLAMSREDLDGGAGVSPTDRSAWLEVGPDITLSMDRIGQTDGYTNEQQADRDAYTEVIDDLQDLAWLGEDIIVPETPWVPETVTVLAARRAATDSGDGSSVEPWPLDRSIEELAVSAELGPSGDERHVVCLAGDDVAPVFGLLTGVNHAHLAVDDGKAWELNVQPHYPGYRLIGDRCTSPAASSGG